MSKFEEPTTSLVDQLAECSKFDEATDESMFRSAIVHARAALTFLEEFGYPRPFVYPWDGGIIAEWPDDAWNTSLEIRGDGSMKAIAIRANHEPCVAVLENFPALADFMHPVLHFKAPNNRFAELFR